LAAAIAAAVVLGVVGEDAASGSAAAYEVAVVE